MADIIRFRTAKKAITRKRKEQAAVENRVKYGRTKAEKSRDAKADADRTRRSDGHRIRDDVDMDEA